MVCISICEKLGKFSTPFEFLSNCNNGETSLERKTNFMMKFFLVRKSFFGEQKSCVVKKSNW